MDLLLVPGAVFFTVFLVVVGCAALLTQRSRMVQRRLAVFAPEGGVHTVADEPSSGLLKERQLSSIASFDRFLSRQSFSESIADDLARADVPLRVGEYLLIRFLCALALLYLGSLLMGNILLAVVAGVAGYLGPKLYVLHAERKRLQQFDDQLVDAITTVSNSLKSGYSFVQGIEAVTRDMDPPISQEFGLVLQEMEVGARTEDALMHLTKRVRSEDLDLLVTSMVIQRTVGGNLAEVLDNIEHTIRERLRIQRDVRTLTAEGRLSGYIIGALPIFIIVVVTMSNRSYSEMLFGTTMGRLMLGASALLEIVGFWVIKRLVAVKV